MLWKGSPTRRRLFKQEWKGKEPILQDKKKVLRGNFQQGKINRSGDPRRLTGGHGRKAYRGANHFVLFTGLKGNGGGTLTIKKCTPGHTLGQRTGGGSQLKEGRLPNPKKYP